MVAEIGDISPFGSARKLAARARQTPTVQGSDLKVRHGRSSKQGPAWLRRAMNQAAQAGMPALMAANCGNFWRPTAKL
jgi:transposase